MLYATKGKMVGHPEDGLKGTNPAGKVRHISIVKCFNIKELARTLARARKPAILPPCRRRMSLRFFEGLLPPRVERRL
jgi:hypothetical protein